jgi:N4-(beta-N-acetylglucosaminyl)-L-asparaginase
VSEKINRREFLIGGAATIASAKIAETQSNQSPTIITNISVKPMVISSANGNFFKNGGDMTCVEKAFTMITQGADVLDSVIAGVNIVELDPEDYSVGYGGVPNADGVVQLDSSCMHGPKKQAGAVAAIEGVKTPSLVARAVSQMTDHHLIVGAGAQRFARNMGFKVEDDLNTDRSRKIWLEWKRKIDPGHYLDPEKRADLNREVMRQMVKEGLLSAAHRYGTINCDGINSKGEVCGVTTTSGLFFKIPGRVGDSPILGAGLYVDNGVGAAGSTGRGEANLFGLNSFLIVENMRRGMHPKDAAMDALKRVKGNTIEKRLLNKRGLPNFNLNFYAINTKGEYAGVALYGEDPEEKGWAGQMNSQFVQFAICNENGPQTLHCEPLLPGVPEDV